MLGLLVILAYTGCVAYAAEQKLSDAASIKNWSCYSLKPSQCKNHDIDTSWCENTSSLDGEIDCSYENLLKYADYNVNKNEGVYNSIVCQLACPND